MTTQEKDITTHVVAVEGIVQKGDKYLIVQRSVSDPQAGGDWSFPGGKIDLEVGDNIIEETLRREIREEVGIEIKQDIELLGNAGFIRVSGHHVVMMTFLCTYASGIAKPLEDQKDVRWCTLQELLDIKQELPSYTYKRVKLLEKNKSNQL